MSKEKECQAEIGADRVDESFDERLSNWALNRQAGYATIDSVSETEDGVIEVVFDLPYGDDSFTRSFSPPDGRQDTRPLTPLMEAVDLSYHSLDQMEGCLVDVKWEENARMWLLDLQPRFESTREPQPLPADFVAAGAFSLMTMFSLLLIIVITPVYLTGFGITLWSVLIAAVIASLSNKWDDSGDDDDT